MGAAKSVQRAFQTENTNQRYLLTDAEVAEDEAALLAQKKSIAFCVENLYFGLSVKIVPVSTAHSHLKSAMITCDDDGPRLMGLPESCAVDSHGTIVVVSRVVAQEHPTVVVVEKEEEAKETTPSPSPKHGGSTTVRKKKPVHHAVHEEEVLETKVISRGDLDAMVKGPPAPPLAPRCVDVSAFRIEMEWESGPRALGHDLTLISKFELSSRLSGGLWRVLAGVDILRGERRRGVAEGLKPKTGYEFRVRARNASEWSEWSEIGFVETEAAPPGRPEPPFSGVLRSDAIALHWRKPDVTNGAPATQFVLRMRHEAFTTDGDDNERACGAWVVIYTGPMLRYFSTGLQPRQFYAFSVAALNTAGCGEFSRTTAFRTPSGRGADDGYAGPENAVMLRAGDLWLECWDTSTDSIFYFHRVTSERTATMPDAFLQLNKKKQEDDEKVDAETSFRLKRFTFLKMVADNEPLADASSPMRRSKKGERLKMELHRASLARDSLSLISKVPAHAFKRAKLYVEYEGENGIDSGGLTKDWYVAFSRALRKPELGLFAPTARNEIEPLPSAEKKNVNPTLEDWRAVGRFLAKAVFDGHCVDLPFCKSVYTALKSNREEEVVDVETLLAEVEVLEPALCKSLTWVLENDIGDGEMLCSTFVVASPNGDKELELVTNGADLAVTESNKREYVLLVARWRARDRAAMEMDALLTGANEIGLAPSLLSPFEESELDQLFNGRREIDVDELTVHAQYQGDKDFDERHTVAIWFWQLLHEFDSSLRMKVLSFATGTNKIPLDGFSPALTLTLDPLKEKLNALPCSHTCFNQIVLPTYSNYETFVKQVKFAVEETNSFELS